MDAALSAIRDRVRAYRTCSIPGIQIGIRAHENLSLSVANSVVAVEEGAFRVDPSLCGHRAEQETPPSNRSSPSPTSYGWQHGCDLFALHDAAQNLVRPLQDRPVRVDRETLTLGYAGVYSSFLRRAELAAQRHDLDVRDILIEVGRRGLVGGRRT